MEADPHTLHHPHARNQAIDGLRGYSVAAVIGVHLLQRFFPGGGLGVDIFFVISGYLMQTLYSTYAGCGGSGPPCGS